MRKSIRKVPIILFLLLLATLMRFAYLPDKISFLYDQGRDALIIRDIIEKGKLTLIGPATDIPGVFHGVLHYYLMLPGYFLSGGHPLGALSLYILFNIAAVYLVFLLGRSLFDRQVGIIASLIMATSYGAIAYSRWLSNPSPVPFFMTLLVYSLYQLTQKKENFFILLAICWAVIFHAEVVAALFFLPSILLVFVFARIKMPRRRILVAGLFSAALILSSYLFFELRHDFLISRNAYRFLIKGANVSLSFNKDIFRIFLEEFEFVILNLRFKMAVLFFLMAFIFLLFRLFTVKSRSEKMSLLIILFWLMGIPLALGFYGHAIHHHFLIGLGPGMILFSSYFLVNLLRKKLPFLLLGFGILAFILINNLFLWETALPENKSIRFYGAQQKLTFDNQIKVIDFVYQDAKGKKFRYEALGLPYFLNHAWEYLFSWYGQKEYHYSPEKEGVDLVYFIIENKIESPEYHRFKESWLEEKELVVDFISETQVNEIAVIRAEKKSNFE